MKNEWQKNLESQKQFEELEVRKQLEELAKELETVEGLQRLGDEAYKEAMEAEKRGSIEPTPKED